jgi:hypothetical protein
MEKHLTYDVAFKRTFILCTEKIGKHAADRNSTVCEAGVYHRQSTKTVFIPDKQKVFFWTKKGRTPETDASVLDYFKTL